ncbi:MAG: sodium:proton antiporter [Ignavibacteria bacterium]|nr:sodium:proton antiporter [Ignavibacteria bacterium]
MNVFHTIGLLLTLAALSGYLNHKVFKLPQTIGLMVIALMVSLLLVALGALGVAPIRDVADFVSSLNFSDVLLHGMLAFLLFAGALHVDLGALRSVRTPVAVLATVGLVIATVLTGWLFWLGSRWLGFEMPFIYALLFGSLIAPTDPIAVMGIIRKVGAPQSLEIKIAGESLFNDGVAVVVFLTILGVATGNQVPDPVGISLFLLKEAAGGILLGLLLGWITYRLLLSVDAYQVEILLTLALASGGYALAEISHVSAPIAIVTAGLLIGNHGRDFAMSEKTRDHLDTFWELVDEILNAVLFMVIGMEIVVLNLTVSHLIVGLCGILAVLLGRFISVSIPVALMRLRRQFSAGVVRILTWGGLRGGISIALALSLPQSRERELIVTVTYIVVIFSVLVQGLTIGKLIRSVTKAKPEG